MRALKFSLAAVGVIAILAAIVLRFVVVPGQAQWPDDVDSTRVYDGTLEVMLNADALASGDLANVLLTDIPITVERHVTTEQVADGDALVLEQATVNTPAGTLLESDTTYAIDRKTMLTEETFGDADIPARQPGLVLGYPIGTEQRDYNGWSDEIGQVTTNEFVGEEEREGRTTYRFHNVIESQPITDPETLAMFPEALPMAAVEQLLPALDLPEETLARFQELAPQLPDPLPLTYTYSNDLTTWVDPTSGVIIDLERTESRAANVALGPATVPVADVFRWTYEQSDTSIADAIADADDAASQLNTFGVYLPIGLVVLGLIALGAAFFVGRGRDGNGKVKTVDLNSAEKQEPVKG